MIICRAKPLLPKLPEVRYTLKPLQSESLIPDNDHKYSPVCTLDKQIYTALSYQITKLLDAPPANGCSFLLSVPLF
jgi:hypothetical protein